MPEKEGLDDDMKKIKETVTGQGEEEGYYDDEEVELDETTGEKKEEESSEDDYYYEESPSREKEEEREREKAHEEANQEKKEEEKEEKPEEETEEEVSKDKEEDLMGDIPEPPTTKKIEVPDIQRGPLFIRVEKFKEAKRKVEDMHEMEEDLKTKMAGLKSTLEEDKNINKNVYEVLRDFQDSMNSIKEIVSPKKG